MKNNYSHISGAPFISIIVASNRPHQLSEFLDNLEMTSADPSSFEVLIKVDSEDIETCAVAESESSRRPYSIITMKTPRGGGYYGLHYAYQELLGQGNTETYFVVLMNDEARFTTTGWDDILRRYIGYFPDNIFRLRISDNRNRRYRSLDECCAYPENFAVTTRAWYQVSEGMGDLWGPDSWHQAIEYTLGKFQENMDQENFVRGVNIDKIELRGTQASVGSSLPEVYDKVRRISIRWRQVSGWQGQENFRRLAARLAAQTHSQAKGFSDFNIAEDKESKVVRTYIVESGKENLVCEISYKLSLFDFCLENFRRFIEPQRNDLKHWFLKVALYLPGKIRRLLEFSAGNLLLFRQKFYQLTFPDGKNFLRIDPELKQLHKVDRKTGEVVSVISYRLI